MTQAPLSFRDQRSVPPRRGRRLLRAALGALTVLTVVLVWTWWRWEPLQPLPIPQTPAAPAAHPGAWPLPGGDAAGSRATSAMVDIDGHVAWEVTAASEITAPLIVGHGNVYVADRSGTLTAYALQDGVKVWSSDVPGYLDAAPLATNRGLIVPTRDGTLRLLDPSTGVTQWSHSLERTVTVTPIVVLGVIVVPISGMLVGLDETSGSEIWRLELPEGPVVANPVADGALLAVAVHRWFALIDPMKGRTQFEWSIAGSHGRVVHLALTDRHLLLVTERATIAVERSKRLPRWGRRAHSLWSWLHVLGLGPQPRWSAFQWVRNTGHAGPPLAHDGIVVVLTQDGTLTAYDDASGAVRWQASERGWTSAPVGTASGFVVARGGTLIRLTPTDGTMARASVGAIGVTIEEVVPLENGLVMRLGPDRIAMLRRP